jgi:hypothetical protein
MRHYGLMIPDRPLGILLAVSMVPADLIDEFRASAAVALHN